MGRRGQPDEAEQATKGGAGDPPPPPPFLEVTCRSSGKVRRFAAGTTARYALHAINRKLEPGAPPALHVEAVRDGGEEPVSFGPSAPLADYGCGWRLQTVTAQDAPGFRGATPPPPPDGDVLNRSGGDAQAAEDFLGKNNTKSTGIYLAKILLAFVLIFLFGGLVTYLLETLPDMIQLASAPQSL
ncbi:hypothetical protein PR202_ga13468 [Eleusine coracana subsp. coracana]|uniref:Uncharacterized protein n=1 Tax=Eleusine coracana subsp. coracana TaxID=191504 RepID=A0AAV5CEU0_ELECO|nr:hypothetical protein QOZ80_3AG0216160 [Eleusine coracana subsp. coracana]GJM96610.1 hypothetical protein PR202_ga13468 [Eleusine coracana subsp. coracana]